MKVRLLVVAGGVLLVASLLIGCGLAFGHDETEDPGDVLGDGAGADSDEDVTPKGNVDTVDVLIIVEDGTRVHKECENREVTVTADDAEVVLDGDCGLVRATGRDSTVDVGSADKIVLVGVDNTISFASGTPEVINHGRNTTVTEGGTAKG